MRKCVPKIRERWQSAFSNLRDAFAHSHLHHFYSRTRGHICTQNSWLVVHNCRTLDRLSYPLRKTLGWRSKRQAKNKLAGVWECFVRVFSQRDAFQSIGLLFLQSCLNICLWSLWSLKSEVWTRLKREREICRDLFLKLNENRFAWTCWRSMVWPH